MIVLIQNGRIYDSIHPEPFKGDIRIEGSKIAAIGAKLEAPEGAKTVDASGLNIYPGLVEAHGHIGLDGWAIGYEGQDYNEYNDPVTPQLRAIDGINPFDESLADAVRQTWADRDRLAEALRNAPPADGTERVLELIEEIQQKS